MPAWDWDQMLLDGTVSFTGTGAGDFVHVGKTPYHEMAIAIHLPSAGTSITLVIQQADDAAGTNVETVPRGSPAAAITTGAKTYILPLFATRPWLRYNCTANTDNFGAVQIGLVRQDRPILP